MQQRQKLEELRKLRRDDPEKFREYIKNHPQLRQRVEDIRQKRENFKGRKTDIDDKGRGYDGHRQDSLEDNAAAKESYRNRRENIRDKSMPPERR